MKETNLSRRTALKGIGVASLLAATTIPFTAIAADATTLPTSGVAAATVNLNLRAGAGTNTKVLTVLKQGTKVTLNGKAVSNGLWQPVVYGTKKGYVSNKYLKLVSTSTPTATATATATTSSKAVPTTTASATTGYASIPAATKYTGPTGVTARGAAIAAEVHKNFPQIATIYGYRNEPGSDHATGHAIDNMLPGNYKAAPQQALGQAIANWAQANASRLGITYVIWNQHIWSVARATEGWRLMPDRGSDTANHKNHVHISYS